MRNDTARKICESLRLKDVMEAGGVQFNSRGFAKCPFHSEKTASLSIKNEHYKCFGCGEYGNAIDFTMRHYGLSFPQAIVKLDSEWHLGIIGKNKKPTHRDRLAARDNELVRQAADRLDVERKANYFALCDLHRDLYGRFINGEDDRLKSIVEDISAALDDFSGEEARFWTAILTKYGYMKRTIS